MKAKLYTMILMSSLLLSGCTVFGLGETESQTSEVIDSIEEASNILGDFGTLDEEFSNAITN